MRVSGDVSPPPSSRSNSGILTTYIPLVAMLIISHNATQLLISLLGSSFVHPVTSLKVFVCSPSSYFLFSIVDSSFSLSGEEAGTSSGGSANGEGGSASSGK